MKPAQQPRKVTSRLKQRALKSGYLLYYRNCFAGSHKFTESEWLRLPKYMRQTLAESFAIAVIWEDGTFSVTCKTETEWLQQLTPWEVDEIVASYKGVWKLLA
jgi:hypothetical protein